MATTTISPSKEKGRESAAKNKEVVKRYLEEGSKNWSVMEECVAEDCVMHFAGIPEPIVGKHGHRALWDQFHRAFPNIETKIQFLVGEGDQVAASFTSEAIQKGEFMGIPASGRRAKASGTSFLRIKDGKIVEDYSSLDQLGLLQQLGGLQSPGQKM